jgi:hypothetical protein
MGRAVLKEFLPQRVQRTRKGRKINIFEYQPFANFAVRKLIFFTPPPIIQFLTIYH